MAKKAKRPVPQGCEEASIKSFLDMIAPSVVSFMPDHFICGNTYRCVWALREYPTSTDEQAILRHLGEKDGVTLRIYTRQVTPAEEKRIIQNAANKNRLNSSNTNDLQQTVTAESNLQDVAAPRQPDARRCGKEACGTRGRRRRARHIFRPGSHHDGRSEHLPRRRSCCVLQRRIRRHIQPVL